MRSEAPHADPDKFGLVEPARTRWLSKVIPRRRVTRWAAAGAVLFAAVVILLGLSIFVLPETLVDPPRDLDQLTPNQRVQAENAVEQTRNSVRTTLIQAVGGGVLFLTFAVALGQLFITREGQLVDRFTKSIDQLGETKKIDVRLGGIYALKQIAERYEYRRPIADIFVAYLKTHSPGTKKAVSSAGVEASVPGSTTAGEEVRLRPDLQAVLRILVGEELWRRAGISRLDLSYITVRNADLPRVDLSNVVLLHANLDGSNLANANLRDADLRHASFVGADLSEADFSNANLSYAGLSHARLAKARFTDGALLVEADFEAAMLSEADLQLADATRAKFTGGANLTNADLRGAVLTDADFADANLRGAKLQGADLEKARDLAGIEIDETTLLDETTRTRIDERLRNRD